MRRPIILTSCLLAVGAVFAVFAPSDAATMVTAGDLEEAGYSSVVILEIDGTRYAPPVSYFRVAERISEADAKKDCPDCVDLVAVHLAKSRNVPDWHSRNEPPLRIVGGRIQARRYHAPTSTVIIVTGPDIGRVSALSDLLLTRTASGS